MQQAVGRIPFHICLLPSAYRLLFKCHRWDSNPHCPDSETGASCQLGYRGNLYEHIFLPTAYRLPFFTGSCRSRTCQAARAAPRFSGPVPAPMGSELPHVKEHDRNRTCWNRGCGPTAGLRLRARTDRSMGAEGFEPPTVSKRLQIYNLAQSPLCHTPGIEG